MADVVWSQVLLLLILSFWVSYYLKVRRIRSVHETIVALFAGKHLDIQAVGRQCVYRLSCRDVRWDARANESRECYSGYDQLQINDPVERTPASDHPKLGLPTQTGTPLTLSSHRSPCEPEADILPVRALVDDRITSSATLA